MYIILYSGRHPSFLFLSVHTKGFSGVQYIQVGKIPQSRQVTCTREAMYR